MEQPSLKEKLVALLLSWGGRMDAHVIEEAEFVVAEFLKQNPVIAKAQQAHDLLDQVYGANHDLCHKVGMYLDEVEGEG